MTDDGSAESAFLRDVNGLDLSGFGRPRTQRLEQHATAMIECEHSRVIFWRESILGSMARLQECDTLRMRAVAGQQQSQHAASRAASNNRNIEI